MCITRGRELVLMIVLVEKLKPLKGFLKIWNPDDFGNLGVNKVRH